MADFPVTVQRVVDNNEELDVVAPGVRFRLCAHGARALALMLTDKAEQLYCDGYRHGGEETMYSCTILGGYERPVLGKAHATCKGPTS